MDVDLKTNHERKELFELLDSFGFKVFKIGKELKRIKMINEGVKEIFAIKI